MSLKRFTRYAWFVVSFTILVILWGAVVRATGAGAGCGNHWPSCNGAIVPQPERIETIIEFVHRITSALSGVWVLLLLLWAVKLFPRRNFGRRMAVLSFIFILIEGAVGAALVRFELTGDNASVARAVVIGLHLFNTFLLLAVLSLTAWWATVRGERSYAPHKSLAWMMGVGLVGTVLLSAMGAVTALGDTLFPMEAVRAGAFTDLSPSAEFLIQLRVIHPLIAMLVSVYLLAIGDMLYEARPRPAVKWLVWAVRASVAVQLAAGVLNILLKAPVWMQVVHLFLADGLWIVLVVLTAELLTEPLTASE